MPLTFENENPIFNLALAGKLAALQEMVKTKSKLLFQKTSDDKDLLMIALEAEHYEMARWLLDTKALFLHSQDNNGNTALLTAIANGKFETVQWIVMRDNLLHLKNKNGYNALQLSILKGHINIAQLLLQHAAYSTEHGSDNGSDTAIQLAATYGHISILQTLTQQKVSMSEKGKNGKTPLLCAVANGQIEAVQWLLRQNASLEEENPHEEDALLIAAANGQLTILEWLLSQGMSLNKKNARGENALLCAAANGQVEAMQYLLNKGLSLNERNKNEYSALMLAAGNGKLKAVKWLLGQGASLTEKNKQQQTAFICAAANGQLDVVQWLVAQGVSPDERGRRGYTPLMYALAKKQLKVAQWLVAHGASLDAKNDRDEGVMLFAINESLPEMIRYLLDKKVPIDVLKDDYRKKTFLAALQESTTWTSLDNHLQHYFNVDEVQQILTPIFSRNLKIISYTNTAISLIRQYPNNPKKDDEKIAEINQQIANIQKESVNAIQLEEIYKQLMALYFSQAMPEEAAELFNLLSVDSISLNQKLDMTSNFFGAANLPGEALREEYLGKAITLFELGNSPEDRRMLLRCCCTFVKVEMDKLDIQVGCLLEEANKHQLAKLAERHPRAFSVLIDALIKENALNLPEWIVFLQEIHEFPQAEKLNQVLQNQTLKSSSSVDAETTSWRPTFFSTGPQNQSMDVDGTSKMLIERPGFN